MSRPKKQFAYYSEDNQCYMYFDNATDAVLQAQGEDGCEMEYNEDEYCEKASPVELFKVTLKSIGKYKVTEQVIKVKGKK